MSQAKASSSAECSLDKPPRSLVCGQDSTMSEQLSNSEQDMYLIKSSSFAVL